MPKRRTAFYTARMEAGLTQMELSHLSGVTQGVISDLETGRNINPTWDVLSRIAQVLKKRPDELIKHRDLPRRKLKARVIGHPLYEAIA